MKGAKKTTDNSTIEQVLEEFLAEQDRRLKPKTAAGYRDVIHLLKDYMDGYGQENLSKKEAALFEKHYKAGGEEHRDFCQLFGPDKIVDELGGFLGYFMVRKVMAGADFKRQAGTVAKKLSKWLAQKGYISEESAALGADESAEAARNLPKAERAASLLYKASEDLDIDLDQIDEKDYLEFDYHTIHKVEPGKLWLEPFEKGGSALGPIAVPKAATGLLEPGWQISCTLGRLRGKWIILEMGNVYP